MIEAELPDGTILEFPEGTSQDVIQNVVRQRIGVSPQKLAPNVMTREAYLDAVEKRKAKKPLVGRGSTISDIAGGIVKGATDIGTTLITPIDMALGNTKSWSNPERRQSVTDFFQNSAGMDVNSLGYAGGRIASNVAGTAGVPAVMARGAQVAGASAPIVTALRSGGFVSPGTSSTLANTALRTGAGAAVGGASAGLVNPEDAGMGAIIGGALPAVAKGAVAAGRAVGGAVRPNLNNPVLKQALEAGAPLGVADITKSPLVKSTRSVLADLPLIGSPATKAEAAKQKWFNSVVGKTFGENADSLTPDVMDSAKKRLGSEFNRIWGNNPLVIDGQFIDDITRIQNDAATKLNPEQVAQVNKVTQNLLQKAQDGIIDGNFVNNWQSELRMIADSEKGLHQKLLGDLRKSTLNAFTRNISPDDAAALALNKQQYRSFKTIEPLLAKAEPGVAGREIGDVPAALLPMSVYQQYGSGASRTPLGQAARMGSDFLVNRVPQTGGSNRAMVQNAALGSAFVGGSFLNPLMLATAPAAYGVNQLLSNPAVARSLATSGAPMNPALVDALRRGAISAPVVATSGP